MHLEVHCRCPPSPPKYFRWGMSLIYLSSAFFNIQFAYRETHRYSTNAYRCVTWIPWKVQIVAITPQVSLKPLSSWGETTTVWLLFPNREFVLKELYFQLSYPLQRVKSVFYSGQLCEFCHTYTAMPGKIWNNKNASPSEILLGSFRVPPCPEL